MSDEPKPRFKRVILKLSGEMLKGGDSFGYDDDAVSHITGEIVDAINLGIEVGVVIGGGNIFRGTSPAGREMRRAVADQIGMIATVVNALVLQEAVERRGVPARVMTAVPCATIETFIRRRAIQHLENKRVVLFGGGTGNPFFTTDSAAALRAAELDADAVLKGTKVDGVYTADPRKDPNAKRIPELSYSRAIAENLNVMDASAFSICRDNAIPIVVYDLGTRGNTRRVLQHGDIGTLIHGD